jgi:hypothetical protein
VVSTYIVSESMASLLFLKLLLVTLLFPASLIPLLLLVQLHACAKVDAFVSAVGCLPYTIAGVPTPFGNLAVACISAVSGVPAAAGVIAFAGIFAVACFPASDCVVPVV